MSAFSTVMAHRKYSRNTGSREEGIAEVVDCMLSMQEVLKSNYLLSPKINKIKAKFSFKVRKSYFIGEY